MTTTGGDDERAKRIEADEIAANKVEAENIEAAKVIAKESLECSHLVVSRPVKVRHRMTTGWTFTLAVIVILLGVGAFFIRQQVQHNQNTITTLQHDNAALQAEQIRAQNAECKLLNGRRLLFSDLSQWLAVDAVETDRTPGHDNAALSLKADIDRQLQTEKLPGCLLVPVR